MKWVIRVKHRVHGNMYYFLRLKSVDGKMKPINCMRYRAERCAAVFPSIAAACTVVRQIDPDVWHCRIRPATCLGRLFLDH